MNIKYFDIIYLFEIIILNICSKLISFIKYQIQIISGYFEFFFTKIYISKCKGFF